MRHLGILVYYICTRLSPVPCPCAPSQPCRCVLLPSSSVGPRHRRSSDPYCVYIRLLEMRSLYGCLCWPRLELRLSTLISVRGNRRESKIREDYMPSNLTTCICANEPISQSHDPVLRFPDGAQHLRLRLRLTMTSSSRQQQLQS
jgi:hypothetical protein